MRFKRNLSPEELRQATATVTVMATTMVMATEMETATVTVMAMTSHGLRISPTEICHSDLVAIPYSLGLPSSEMNLVKDIKKTKLFKHCNLNELLKYVEFKEV